MTAAPTRLTTIHKLTATLELRTGLLIGAGDAEMHIGGTDKSVQKHPHTKEPYIPGSSLKGRMRSLLEWRAGLVGISKGGPFKLEQLDKVPPPDEDAARSILRLFGFPPSGKDADKPAIAAMGPTRLSFWDCPLQPAWTEERRRLNQLLTEVKSENAINRISGVAEHPRFFERVPAGARFDFALSWKVLDGDEEGALESMILEMLKLVELDALGGQGSRGYGKVRFSDLRKDGELWKANLDDVAAFDNVA